MLVVSCIRILFNDPMHFQLSKIKRRHTKLIDDVNAPRSPTTFPD